jgi:hypothetical protein
MKEGSTLAIIGLILVILALIANQYMITRMFVMSLDMQNGIYQIGSLTNMGGKK